MSLLLVIALFVLFTSQAAGKPRHERSLTVRLQWLEQRVKVHRFGCRHRIRNGWHCKALVWTRREVGEARAEYEQRWELWLPAKFYRVARCETGVRWDWDSGTYVSAYGIIRPAYDNFARALGLAAWNGRNTPRDQYRVADAIRARYGWRAWGCGGA